MSSIVRLEPTLINVDSINIDDSNQASQDHSMSDRLTAIEAAARLGVKRETLYAYVSRGLLDLRVGYRATWWKVRRTDDNPDPVKDLIMHGPDLRLDAGFMVSRVRDPKFFHRLGISIGMQIIVGVVGFDAPVMASPRFGLAYAFG